MSGVNGGIERDEGSGLDGHEADGQSKKLSITFCAMQDISVLIITSVAVDDLVALAAT